MKLLQFLFRTLWTVGYLGNGILVLYIEWSYLRLNFTQIFNPFVHWQVAGTLLTSPLFWVLLGISSLGYYGYTSTKKRIKRYEKIKQSRKISIDNSKINIRPISSDGFKYQQERTSLEEPLSLSANSQTEAIPVSSVQQDNVKAPSIEAERQTYVGTDVSITYPDRRYIKYKFDQLKEIVKLSRSNVQILSEIQNELGYRRSRRKHKLLYEDIVQRLIQLQNRPFPWPNTTATFGSGNLSSDVFINSKGMLKQYEYKVGIKGLPESQRRHILDLIFIESLSFDGDATYLSDWGNPSTSTRLRKMAESIAAFTRNGKRHKINDLSQAIKDWESDLVYLKRTYYEGYFYFDWPRTDT